MEQLLAKYMKYGKLVKNNQTGQVFKLMDDMDEGKPSVKAIPMEDLSRYELLTAWSQNWDRNAYSFRERFTENIEECRAERLTYEKEIQICDVSPANKVRFVGKRGTPNFVVNDLDVILVNGTRALVVYQDEMHFTFATGIAMNLYGNCFHLDQFAEICDRHSVVLERLKPEENTVMVFSEQLNADGRGDFIKCIDCGTLQLAALGAESCGSCKGHNLMWADEKRQECDKDTLILQGYVILNS